MLLFRGAKRDVLNYANQSAYEVNNPAEIVWSFIMLYAGYLSRQCRLELKSNVC